MDANLCIRPYLYSYLLRYQYIYILLGEQTAPGTAMASEGQAGEAASASAAGGISLKALSLEQLHQVKGSLEEVSLSLPVRSQRAACLLRAPLPSESVRIHF